MNRDGGILLHGNACPHIPETLVEKLQSLNYEIFQHLPYSSHISPTDHHLFKHLEVFVSNKTIAIREVIEIFAAIFLKCNRWQKKTLGKR